jgi:hypothetical protein
MTAENLNCSSIRPIAKYLFLAIKLFFQNTDFQVQTVEKAQFLEVNYNTVL